MTIPKIYFDNIEGKWFVTNKKGDSGAICFGDCSGSSGNSIGSLYLGDTGVFGGGYNKTDTIDYITISTPGNAQNFGKLIIERFYLAATSNGTNDRGVFGGGYLFSSGDIHENTKLIDYITISTPGNAQVFGNLDLNKPRFSLAATSNGTNNRGVFGGGKYEYGTGALLGGSLLDFIEYITISTLGNAQRFGKLSVAKDSLTATSNGTNDRGVFGGGESKDGYLSFIEYITISTPGDAQNFGNLSSKKSELAATSNGTNNRGVFGGGLSPSGRIKIIDYITISTPGNAQNFGNLTVARRSLAATSNA